MNAPQIILIALWSLSLGLTIADHGKPKTGKQNAWLSVIALVINAFLLYWGGFWS